ncbi:hypothetical protein [Gemmobacter denitrificans]|uniref:NlpC/P60 domain-containing protein n=1 Tax=Gemmobacter denitrificans TaxID=3123040 RepID=A0ABU8C0N8_9RHOB
MTAAPVLQTAAQAPAAHWASRYVGQPFDPAEQHCWAFARRVWREVFGWDVAALDVSALDPRRLRRDFADHPEYGQWRQVQTPVEAPVEGDAVIMAQGRHPCHIGIWIAPARVLHAIAGSGGIATPVGRLGDLGYRLHGFWRRVGA